ncbi:MAG: HEAT repeat domain-containing protein [Pirellulales bacterium]|nr:HEAT repeat domain-containing protein [Pirellulales bacterium]
MSRGSRCITVLMFAVLSTSVGCGSMSFSAFDKLAFWKREVVPEDILARHGPTASQYLEKIDKLGQRAAKASPTEQQAIAEQLAQAIRAEQDALVRLHLIQAISPCRAPIAAAVLHAGLNDEDLDVQLAACEELSAWESPKTTTLLGQIVESGDEPLDLRLAAIETLGKFKDAAAADVIAPALESNADPALQYRAVKSLAKMTGIDYGNDLVAWRNHFGKQTFGNSGEQYASPDLSSPTSAGVRQAGFQQ